MTRAFSFAIPGKPQPKQRARRGRGGRWYTPAATRRYEDLIRRTVALAAPGAGLRPNGPGGEAWWAYFLRPVRVDIAIHWPDRRRRDADNVAKAVLDGLQPQRRHRRKVGVGALADDDLVQVLHVTTAIDREHPRVEVTVRELEPLEGAAE